MAAIYVADAENDDDTTATTHAEGSRPSRRKSALDSESPLLRRKSVVAFGTSPLMHRQSAHDLEANAAAERTTWTAAKARADAALAAEREAGTGFAHLLAVKEKTQATVASMFAPPTTCSLVLSFTIGILGLPAGFLFARALKFSVISQTAFLMVAFNILLKRWANLTTFANDDTGALRCLRMFDPAKIKWCKQVNEQTMGAPSCRIRGGWYGPVTVVTFLSFGFSLPGLFGCYALIHGRLAVHQHCMFWLGFAVFMTATRIGGMTSNFFLASAEGLRSSIERFAIWELSPGTGAVDFRAAYENFFVMSDTVRSFSLAWKRFFFVAEFGLVLATVCLSLACVNEFTKLVDEINATAEASLAVAEQAFRAATVAGFFAMMLSYIVCLFAAGSALTAASKGVALRAHTLTLQLAMIDPNKEHVKQGELFERQVAADHCPAFQSFGISITSGLGAKIAYVIVSVAMTLLFSRLNSYK